MKLSVPMPLRLVLLVLGTTAFYMYLGQIVPQKEAHPPPPVLISAEMTTEDLVAVGAELASGKGQCLVGCHTVGQSGPLRYPDLDGIGARAATRIEGLSGLEYLAQSLYEPAAFIVPGFADGMQPIDQPPISLSEDEMKAVIAWLQSLGGTPTVTLDTDLGY